MMLIGSRALLRHFPNPARKSLDIDYIATIDEFEGYVRNAGDVVSVQPFSEKSMVVRHADGTIVEFEIAWPGSSSADILEMFPNTEIAPLNILLLLKLSHRYLRNSPHFLKTMRDIKFLREVTALCPALKLLLKKREKETYNYAHPKLNQNKGNFFDASVVYTYDHDSIHEAVAVGERPAYTHFQKDGAEVYTSKQKFFALDLDTRLNAGLEESYVLAIERSLVPHPGVKTPREAFEMALSKVCTSITSGWFREFCWDNYDAIVAKYNEDYFAKFEQALVDGRIRPAVALAA